PGQLATAKRRPFPCRSTHATAPIGYVRLHGRNYDQWFEHEAPHDRYNYLYSEGELAQMEAAH
ncbi:MAG TPA: hypothetical protein VES66_00115, partial [Terriglobales bacterium]|nr:hypothetical protein [Terriglobales bacterium]